MRQEVRFCRVPGGRVACAAVGDGPPLVLAPWWISHIELDWERPDFRAFVEALARFQREACSAEAAAEHLGFVYSVDVREDLPRVQARTLVLHRRDDRAISYELGR